MTQAVATRAQKLTEFMWEAGVLAANTEIDTHEYTNRTGFLELSTGAQILANTPMRSTINVVMGTEYATYIVDEYDGPRKPLSNFRVHMDELTEFFDKNLPLYLHSGGLTASGQARRFRGIFGF